MISFQNDIINTALALAFGFSLLKVVKNIITKNGTDVLSTVGDSSRLIAASRAVESLEDENSRLFYDPLAFILAGKKHLDACTKQAKRVPGWMLTTINHRFYKISLNAARVWWFDKEILQALRNNRGGSASVSSASTTPRFRNNSGYTSPVKHNNDDEPKSSLGGLLLPLLVNRQSRQKNGIRQVVVLGSGMDTRPWRLDLPKGVHWYEVDTADVLKAKTATLKRHGAQLYSNTLGNERYDSSAATAYKLKAATWNSVVADVGVPGWSRQLIRGGFDPALDTLWVLEGLLMYFAPPEVTALLKEAAANSGDNSVLIAHTITDELLYQIKATKGRVDYPPFSRDLLNTWQSGISLDDPSKELVQVGWSLNSCYTRAEIAHELCGTDDRRICEGLHDFEVVQGQGNDRYTLFYTATKLPASVLMALHNDEEVGDFE